MTLCGQLWNNWGANDCNENVVLVHLDVGGWITLGALRYRGPDWKNQCRRYHHKHLWGLLEVQPCALCNNSLGTLQPLQPELLHFKMFQDGPLLQSLMAHWHALTQINFFPIFPSFEDFPSLLPIGSPSNSHLPLTQFFSPQLLFCGECQFWPIPQTARLPPLLILIQSALARDVAGLGPQVPVLLLVLLPGLDDAHLPACQLAAVSGQVQGKARLLFQHLKTAFVVVSSSK